MDIRAELKNMMEEKGLTVADAIALRDSNGTNNMNDGFGNNGAWWIIVFVLFFAPRFEFA